MALRRRFPEIMKSLTGAEVRESYLRWFEARGHHRYPSDSLVPANDPTLLFTGAGMNQFKDMFLGKGTLPWKRITTAQKCLRVPDLENVGRTTGHHTFFEMLGNFSFGDYFKAECLQWVFAWFTEELGLPRDRLVVTVYLDDDEAYAVWRDTIGMPTDRIYRFGEKENFWPAQAPSKGPNGPCGPCSEIYFDLEGGPLPAHDGLSELPRRFVEIGNCVFTQFDRQSDGSLPALPQRNIDVGLGLERITAVLQGKRSNFETDLFTPYVDFVAARAGKPYGATPHDDIHLRRIADHARAVTFCISDGALPANEGRGYVVRKILRRACRDGYELGLSEPFLAEVCGIVCDTMRGAYPALEDSRKQVQALVLQEERAFRAIYTRGIDRFEQWFATLEAPSAYPKVEVEERGALALPPNSGAVAFELHDTFGFPVDITRALLLDRDFALDEAGFEAAMEQQRDRARKGSALSGDVFADNALTRLKARKVVGTRFIGYDQLEGRASIVGIVSTQQGLESDVNEVHAAVATPSVSDSPMEAVSLEVIVDVTPFYAESGGQVGDRGTIEGPHGSGRVVDCKKREDYWFHVVEVTAGKLSVGDPVTLRVDSEARRATERNHTATHLLHAALKRVVGEHVGQAGSLVAPERLRFDFTHGERLGPAVLRRLEDEVTAQVLAAFELAPCEMRLDEARRSGFVAMFGEKYGDVVRTLAIGDYSRELCGGTHVANTGNIGAFRILSEASVAAGVRRLEAITGFDALHAAQDERDVLDRVARDLKAKPEEVPARIDALRQELRRLEKEVEEARREKGKDATAALEAAVEVHGPHASLVAKLEGADNNALLDSLDRLRRKHDSFVGVLVSAVAGGVAVVVTVSPDLVTKGLHAGKLVQELTSLVGGGGGGRPEMAQGRGKDASKIDEACAKARSLVAALIGGA